MYNITLPTLLMTFFAKCLSRKNKMK